MDSRFVVQEISERFNFSLQFLYKPTSQYIYNFLKIEKEKPPQSDTFIPKSLCFKDSPVFTWQVLHNFNFACSIRYTYVGCTDIRGMNLHNWLITEGFWFKKM